MSNRKNWVSQLASERYFVWAIVFMVVVGAGVLGQIAIANVQLDSDAMSTSYLTIPHASPVGGIHKKR